MSLKVLCSGHLVRHPLGGHSWHHLQYLVGLQRMGHEVAFFEDWGWPNSCYDAQRDEMTADPSYGINYLRQLLRPHGLAERWCYLAENGQAHGMSRAELSAWCRECDLYLNLSNMNWIDKLTLCRRRALVDTDPVFTQIGAHGMGGPLDQYHALLTYGENVHRAGCTMPTAGRCWLPTRQPVVLDLWPVASTNTAAAWTSVINWTAYGEHEHGGRVYGQKDREFEPYWDLPRRAEEAMELAVAAPGDVKRRLAAGGWSTIDPLSVTRDPQAYQSYLARSRGEWCVAKHGYVVTQCGWFSDRSAGYLASGRPVVLQDTGFNRNLPCGRGLVAFTTHEQAVSALHQVREDYAGHCRAARQVAVEYFDASRVLGDLLERCL